VCDASTQASLLQLPLPLRCVCDASTQASPLQLPLPLRCVCDASTQASLLQLPLSPEVCLGASRVCAGEVRKIDELPVFLVTALFSLWAYIWLWVVFVGWTPDEVTFAEAWITVLMFPLLVVVAYMADQKYFAFGKKGSDVSHSPPSPALCNGGSKW
jgi:hypothetical protein